MRALAFRSIGRPRALTAGPPAIARVLPFDPVLFLVGDSQTQGTTESGAQAAEAAAYAATDRVKILDRTGAWVTYAPGSKANWNTFQASGDVNAGAELGFIQRFRAEFPKNTLYIIKNGNPGTFQGRGPSVGTITASGSGTNQINVSAGAITQNKLLVGSGIPTGTYSLFAATAPNWYVGGLGTTAARNVNFASTTVTMYDAIVSFEVTQGGLYVGANNNPTSFLRARAQAALAALAAGGGNPRIVAVMTTLGTNDKINVDRAGEFSAAQLAFYRQLYADFSLGNAKLIWPRVNGADTHSVTVRTNGLANVKASGEPWTGSAIALDMDGAANHDGLHWTMATLKSLGDRMYDVAFKGATGL